MLRLSQGDLSVAPAILKEVREAAAKDTLQGFWYHWAPLVEAWVAVEQGRPDADRLVERADSLWRGREGFSAVASIQLARLYEKQGRTDRALRAVRRRYSPNGEPEPTGLAEAYRLEGKYAAQLGDRTDAIRAYRYYLRMRADPEPSRIPQRDSVRAELGKGRGPGGGAHAVSETLARLTAALADRYRIEREVGAGGMATVYLAEDLRHGRQVALKVLRPELAATLGSERFFREIQVAARLQHPHILPLHDSGEAGGFLYFVMPYVEGESLRERLARVGELPVHDAVKILVEVVDALAYAHSQGVVHRDIKPDNVMLSGRHALVTDFGVAKAVSEATGRQQLTTAGVALGTPTLHGAGAGGRRPEPRPPGGHLRRRRHGVRAAHRAAAVHRHDLAADPRGARDAGARPRVPAPAHLSAGARGGHHALPGQARGGPLPDRRGAAAEPRAAGHAERRDDADADAAGDGVAAGHDGAESGSRWSPAPSWSRIAALGWLAFRGRASAPRPCSSSGSSSPSPAMHPPRAFPRTAAGSRTPRASAIPPASAPSTS